MANEMERKALNSDSDEFADPWRCAGPCGQLIYNTVWFRDRLYPVPGAPEAQFLNERFPRVCRVCYEMYRIAAEREHVRRVMAQFGSRAKRLDSGQIDDGA